MTRLLGALLAGVLALSWSHASLARRSGNADRAQAHRQQPHRQKTAKKHPRKRHPEPQRPKRHASKH